MTERGRPRPERASPGRGRHLEVHRVSITSPKRLGALALMAVFAVAACSSATGGSTGEPTASDIAPSANAPAPSGDPVAGGIIAAGSSTVEPVTTGVAEAFKAANPDFSYTVTGEGTGDGFARFCAGEVDIADASRAIKPEGEADVCAANGVEYVELKVALDGISVLTSVNGIAIDCLSFADLYALTGPESIGFETWAGGQEIATALGSSTALPDAPLVITGPGEESGTFDFYVETVIAPIAEARGQPEDQWTTRPDYIASANDNAIIEGIAGSDSSLGWVGFAFLEENLDKVKPISVAVDADGTCVEPTAETIASGEYPISRDLFIYVNTAKTAENPALKAFVDYYLAEGTIASVFEVVPYVNLAPDALAASQATWASAIE
jgi:phosphate transport system substrate-binding protein